MAGESTALEALTAEMLGDIGKLHDAVVSLKGVLPGQIQEVETKIAGLIGLLQQAGDVYKGQVEAYTNAQGEIIKVQMEKDAQAARDTFNDDSRAAIAASLKMIRQDVIKTIEAEVSGPMDAIRWHQKTRLWSTLALCLCAGIVGGILGVFGSAYFIRDQHATTNVPSPVVNQKR